MWDNYINDYRVHLRLEKGFSQNTLEAYIDDVNKLILFIDQKNLNSSIKSVSKDRLRDFILWINEIGLAANTQARIISGIRNFFNYLVTENILEENPADLVEMPKIARKLPVVLEVSEIDKMIEKIDHSKPDGQRNHSIIEIMFGCGLRVSEVTNLTINGLFPEKDYIRVTGKGNKERIVPMGSTAKKFLLIYLKNVRNHMNIRHGNEDYVYLNKFGSKLSRVTVFQMIKHLAEQAGIKKNISPHTFRHSFATHLVQGGADLRAVQEMLGHESIITTEIYTHLDTAYLKDTIIQYHPRS